MTIFWVLLVLAFLFVIGSASALRYFDHRAMAKLKQQSQEKQSQESKQPADQAEDKDKHST